MLKVAKRKVAEPSYLKVLSDGIDLGLIKPSGSPRADRLACMKQTA